MGRMCPVEDLVRIDPKFFRFTLGIAGVVVVATFVTSARALAVAENSHVKSHEEQAVRDVLLNFSGDWNSHEMVSFGRLFDADAEFVNVGGLYIKGSKNIQLIHSWLHGTIPDTSPVPGMPAAAYGIFKNIRLTFGDIEVRFLRADVAVAHVQWELIADARSSKSRNGILMFVLTKQDSRWLIAAAQNTEAPGAR